MLDDKDKTLEDIARQAIHPLWLSSSDEIDDDIEYIGWRFFFQVLEEHLGRNKLLLFMEDFIKERDSITIAERDKGKNDE